MRFSKAIQIVVVGAVLLPTAALADKKDGDKQRRERAERHYRDAEDRYGRHRGYIGDDDRRKEEKERAKDRREAWREAEKDRREAQREWENNQREAEREYRKDQLEAEREYRKEQRQRLKERRDREYQYRRN